MLRGCSIAWMLLTISLASGAGDHVPAVPDALLAWASIGVSLSLDSLARRNFGRYARQLICFWANTETNRSWPPASTRAGRVPGSHICRNRLSCLAGLA